ncbi:MAG: RNA ligase [Patescibacteria group bacterium]
MNPQILIEYIKANGLDALSNNKKTDVKRHKSYPNLVMLKYKQIEADFNDEIVRICRGIILDESNDWQVVNYTYSKFMNYSEGSAAKIDWDNARVYEKLDGSLCQLYYYDNKWQVATSGTPDASGQVGDFKFTFAELFWKTWNELKYKLPIDTNYCYALELMTPFNKVIVPHKECKLVLHGGRNLKTMKELNPVVEAHLNGWKCVETFSLTSLDAVLEMAKTLDPLKQEGFVVCDWNYNRVKLKTEQYVNLAHLRDSVGASLRQMLEVVRKNEGSEFLVYFPEMTKTYYDLKIKYEHLLGQVEGFYDAIKHIDDRKIFASYATTQPFSGLLFGIKYGKISSFKQGLADMNVRSLESLMGMESKNEPNV